MNDQQEPKDPQQPPQPEQPQQPPAEPPVEIPREARKWAMICHISALAGLLGNGIGFLIAPLVVWMVKKEDHPFIDDQGKEAVNFQITMILALFLCIPLIFVIIGIPLAIIIGLLMVILPIIAAVKANDGVVFRYPLTLRIIK
jgi:uncharacterized Tic20 family protein